MERTNSNFNLFDFDVEGFAQAYYQQPRARQQSGNTSPQASFEQQMDELQLNSSDENSAKSSSPDQSPTESGEGIRRADLGGSMRMPPYSRLRDNSFSTTRHSVDLPALTFEIRPKYCRGPICGKICSAARAIPCHLRSSPRLRRRTAKVADCGRVSSQGLERRLGQVAAKSRRAARRSWRSFQLLFARITPSNRPAYPMSFEEDEALLERFKDQATGRMSDGTIRNAQADVRNFSAWLSRNRRAPIARRLGNPEMEPGLERDLEEYAKAQKDPKIRSRRTIAALNKLRNVEAGNILSTSSSRLAPYPADATLIDMWTAAEKATHRIEPETVDRQARRLYRLSDWLQTREKGAMAGQLNDDGLTRDVEQYRQQTEDTKINADLLRLRRYQQVLEANRALGLPPPEDARPFAEAGAQQPASPQELPVTPATPSAGAWDWFREQMQEPASFSFTPHQGPQPSPTQGLPATPATPSAGAWDWFREPMQEPASSSFTPRHGPQPSPSQGLPATPATPSAGAWNWFREQMQAPEPSSASARSSEIYGGLEPLVNLNPPTPYQLRDDAHSAPAPELAGAASFVGPSGTPEELLDIGAIVGEGWRHGSQSASDVLIDVMSNINLLPNQFGPSQFAINGEHYSATFGPGGRRDVRLIHHPRARAMNEAGPSNEAEPSNEAGPSRQPVADLGFLIRGGWQHRERWLPTYLVRVLEGEHRMPEVGRPTHINIRGVPYRAELQETDGAARVRIYPEAR